MESAPKKEETKQNKFDWADEGLSALVRVVILSWSAAILTLNYVTIPGVPQKNIDRHSCQRVYWDFSHIRGCSYQEG